MPPRRSEREHAFKKGDRVKARFEGGKEYYEGIVRARNEKGTYDVLFDDGDVDTKVPQGNIVPLPTAAGRTKKARGPEEELGISTANGENASTMSSKVITTMRFQEVNIARTTRNTLVV